MAASTCEMIVGYLIPHKCPNRVVGKCQKCGLQFCDEHLSIEQNGLICTACQQGLDQPIAISATARTFTEDDLASWNIHDSSIRTNSVFPLTTYCSKSYIIWTQHRPRFFAVEMLYIS